LKINLIFNGTETRVQLDADSKAPYEKEVREDFVLWLKERIIQIPAESQDFKMRVIGFFQPQKKVVDTP